MSSSLLLAATWPFTGMEGQSRPCFPTERTRCRCVVIQPGAISRREKWPTSPSEVNTRFLLRIRSCRSLDDPPRLDSDDVFARGSWHFGLAWHPQKPLLAVLAEHRISFALPLDGRLMNNSWVVKSFANDIAWISDDELAVAFDDANIRIYSWDENNPSSFSSSLNRKLAKTKVVLEAHQNSVYSIASELDSKIFVTVDIADRLHVWSANGNHLGEFLVPANERTSQPALLAIYPARPIIALSRYNVLYKKALDIFPDTIAASQVEPEKKAETLLSRLLRRAVFLTRDIDVR